MTAIAQLKLNVHAKGSPMHIKVEEIQKRRVKIKVLDFELINSIANLETKLILIFRHIARFDIKAPELMMIKGSVKISMIKIYQDGTEHDPDKVADIIISAAEKSLWVSQNSIEKPGVISLVGGPGFEIEYGYGSE